MTKLDLTLARLAKLPPEQQEAIAAEINWFLDEQNHGDEVLTEAQWSEVRRRLADQTDTLIPHEEIEREFGTRAD